MQSQNPFLDEFAKMTANAMSLAQAAGEEAKSAFRAQADRFVADMDLVRREEMDALVLTLRVEIADLRAQVAALKGEAPAPKRASAKAQAKT
ncbi:MAG: accessory factor UbiK family protein [Asticcacaulis sp.]|uniref:accessory factor UbiK family protein n=1 Tax=Asticcacaulis sp. TaxID=1872648 RepID=UPI003F7C89E8